MPTRARPSRSSNPATGETIAEVPRLGAAETRRAIEAARARAARHGRRRTAKDRAKVLRRLATLMSDRSRGARDADGTEQGKPLAEARVEVEYALSFYEWFAEEAKRLDGGVIPTPWPEKRIVVTKSRSASPPASRRGTSPPPCRPESRARARSGLHDGAQACGADAALARSPSPRSPRRRACRQACSRSSRAMRRMRRRSGSR